MIEEEICITGKSVLLVPGVVVNSKPLQFNATSIDNKPVCVKASTFGMAASVQRNMFNRQVCYNLSKVASHLYFYILFNLNYNSNVINLNLSRVNSETGMSVRSVSNALDELAELKVLYKTSMTSTYVINPKCITNCNAKEFERRYLAEMEYCETAFNSKNELIYIRRYENLSN